MSARIARSLNERPTQPRTAQARWLVTGACGRLGGHVMSELRRRGHQVQGTSRHPCHSHHGEVAGLDLNDRVDLLGLLERHRPTHILHLAGVTSPAEAERAPESAWQLNVEITRWLAEYARATRAHLLFASTDFVWSGEATGKRTEADRPANTGVYAETKIAAEQAVLAAGAGAVVRYSGMYGLPRCERPTLFERQLGLLRGGQPLTVVTDEYRTPVSLVEGAEATVRVSEARYQGVVHVAGPDVLTPEDQVRIYAKALAVDPPRLELIRRCELDGRVRRPWNMAMATAVLSDRFADVVPHGLTRDRIRQAALLDAPPIAELAAHGG